jgi:hypothetical protein
LHPAAPVQKEPDLTRNLTRKLAQGARQLGTHHLIGVDPSLVELFQPLAMARL